MYTVVFKPTGQVLAENLTLEGVDAWVTKNEALIVETRRPSPAFSARRFLHPPALAEARSPYRDDAARSWRYSNRTPLSPG